MRITWVTRSYLDYRCAVHEELDKICNHQLTIISFADLFHQNVKERSQQLLGDRFIALTGERRICGTKVQYDCFANSKFRLTYQPGLVREVLKTKPDVMFADAFFQWSTAALWIRMTRKIPYVMGYERTLWVERKAQWYRKLSRKMALPWIDRICANGSLCKEYLVSLGYKADKIFERNMAADSEQLALKCSQVSAEENKALREQYSLGNKLVFLYVGALSQRKGIIPLLKGWKNFQATNQDAVLLLVGREVGSSQEVGKFVQNENIPNIVFVGTVNYPDLYRYYAMADCFVIATLEDNWSLVVPEAMACGLPIMCSQYNGCYPELVHESNGRVFDPLDTDDTAQAFEEMWQKRDRFVEMGEESKRIVEDYSPRRIAETIYAACEAAIADHQKRKWFK